MNWLSSNWIWLALGVGALALFSFGGGCGMGHGGHGHGRREEEDQPGRPRETPSGPLSMPTARIGSSDAPLQPSVHVHGASANEAAPANEHAGHGSTPASQSEPRRHRHGC